MDKPSPAGLDAVGKTWGPEERTALPDWVQSWDKVWAWRLSLEEEPTDEANPKYKRTNVIQWENHVGLVLILIIDSQKSDPSSAPCYRWRTWTLGCSGSWERTGPVYWKTGNWLKRVVEFRSRTPRTNSLKWIFVVNCMKKHYLKEVDRSRCLEPLYNQGGNYWSRPDSIPIIFFTKIRLNQL